jgi:hypothetical protein
LVGVVTVVVAAFAAFAVATSAAVASAAAAGVACADEAVGGAMAGDVAARAAAAIASGGAVPLPDAVVAVAAEVAEVAAGAFVDAMMTGSAMGAAFATADTPPGCADALESVEELSSDDDLSVDFVVPAFEPSAVGLDCWDVPALAAAFEAVLALESCPAGELEVFEALLAAWSVAVPPEDCELFWFAEESLAGRGAAGGAAEVVPLLLAALLVAAAVLLSTSAPKLSLPCEGVAGRCGAS